VTRDVRSEEPTGPDDGRKGDREDERDMRPRSETNGERAAGSRALFYRPPFVSWVGHLSFVLRSLPLRSLRSLRETNGGYE